MAWAGWWSLQFLISAVIWLGLAPRLGTALLRRLDAGKTTDFLTIESKNSLAFVLGYALTGALASFFVPFHKAGLPLLLVALTLVISKERSWRDSLKLNWTDIIATAPILIGCFLSPVAIDTNTGAMQFSLSHDSWPMDWAARLDTHIGLASLFSFWFRKTPLINALSVQGPFLALLAWRTLNICLECILSSSRDRSAQQRRWERLCLLAAFLGTVYFRREIYMKGSPVGILFVALAFGLFGRTANLSPVLGGFISAMSLYYGEVGALFFLPAISILLLSETVTVFRLAPWVLLFSLPEIIRKVFLFSGGKFSATAYAGAAVLLLVLAMLRISSNIKKTNPESTKSRVIIWTVPASLLAAIFLAVFAAVEMPFIDGWLKTAPYGLYFLTVQREGIAFIATVAFFLINWRNREFRWFSALMASPFVWFFIWHIVNVTGAVNRFNPGEIWVNVVKDSAMFCFPVLTTIGAAALVLKLKVKPWRIAILLFLIFIQDPLVASVNDGPLSPLAPRFSVVRSVYEQLWNASHKATVASEDGSLVLSALALPIPSAVSKLSEFQNHASKRLEVCINAGVNKPGVAPFDVAAYTFEYPVGCFAKIDDGGHCDFHLNPASSAANVCPNDRRFWSDQNLILCQD